MIVSGAEDGNAIDRIAAEWAGRSLLGLAPEERAALAAWRAADPRHAGSYLRAVAIGKLAVKAHTEDRQAVAEPVPAHGEAAPRSFVLSRRRLLGAPLAVSLALAVGLGVYHQFMADRISTERGEIRNVALSDGSAAVLNTVSTIDVRMEPARRTIDLVTGQAWFDVAHDPARPFEVHHGDMIVRATGTAFQVSALQDGMEVVVTEGTVVVLRAGGASPIAQLRAGQRLTVEQGQVQQRSLDPIHVEQSLAWQQGMIVLDGEPLAAAVEKVNRYNDIQIEIATAQLGSRRVYGTFRARDPEGLAKAVAIALDAEVEKTDDRILLK
ncbi:FecR family protein [Novosphingobium album (ex Liu et al. 2023)]|uniref:FecR domain-containing protein n=1 Tax=Novosphingobium album (ex Liu et al. 2023) TaxID=3031130 RepID=A0ABT5WRT1_9SPHN|nr:FecR domain-containing protein [Novosphingobium album (ex Liu et al. 2023)]MDE8652559.1 FecR domain-containing protein [Novosphingobium album (ex Liu et al. 2023)]